MTRPRLLKEMMLIKRTIKRRALSEDALKRRLRRKRRAGFAVLLWESLSGSWWRTFFWGLFFAGLFLWRAPSMFGQAGEYGAWLIFTIGLIWFGVRGLRDFHWPRMADVDRRLEQASALRHRPLDALEDQLSHQDHPDTHILWRANAARARRMITALKIPAPQPRIGGQDPFALRMLALLLCVSGLIAAGPQSAENLRHGMMPYSLSALEGAGGTLNIWATPPDYTNMDVIALTGAPDKDTAPIIPAGSVVKARLHGGIIPGFMAPPVLAMGDHTWKMRKLDDGNWGADANIADATAMQVRRLFMPVWSRAYQYKPDTPPVITADAAPRVLEKGELLFRLTMEDDYGVAALETHMSLADGEISPVSVADITDHRPLSTQAGRPYQYDAIFDLAGHVWAGLKVNVTFTAIDRAGQRTATAPITITLPERAFRHPVAQAIILERKNLLEDTLAHRYPVAYRLETIMASPGAYQGDVRVFLALRTAASRLAYARADEDIGPVLSLLWDTALRVEDGNLTHAMRDMRNARHELQKLLNDPNASKDDIAQALARLQNAIGEYMTELVREMQKQIAANPALQNLSPEMFGKNINLGNFDEFLAQLQAQAMAGNMDAARDMLSQLDRMMEMMDPSRQQASLPEDVQYMMEAVQDLQELIRDQRELLAETTTLADLAGPPPQSYSETIPFDPDTYDRIGGDDLPPPPTPGQKAQATPPKPGGMSVNSGAEAARQENLRARLGGIMLEADQALGQIPQTMQEAEHAMRAAAKELNENRPLFAPPHQQAALDALEQAQDNMSQSLSQRLQEMIILSFGAGQLDPLGRPMREDGEGDPLSPYSQIEIPDESARRRVQDILRLLRQRSGEIHRPDYELDYYRRLMRQF